MKEMIKARKAELEARGTKGFTLMEMLIVVAIIAVLVAIAIPVFTAQLNNARVQADAANIRSGYATVSATVLTAPTTGTGALADGTTYGLNSDGSITAANGTGNFACQGTASETQNIAGQSLKWTAGQTPTYKFNATATATAPTVQITGLSN